MRRYITFLFVLALTGVFARAGTAEDILKASGVKGGLVVCIGCDDPALLVGLRASDAYLVHGLDTDPAAAVKAREFVAGKGLSGKITADTFDGKTLPFIDNVVNLLAVAGGKWQVAREEMVRVLAPRGVAVSLDSRLATRDTFSKPVPSNIDEWNHYLHDPGNNAVAHDEVVGPPRRLQWQCGPRWSRHHDHMASVSAIVSAGGRIFYILDEGSRVSPQLPPDWQLVARDAFNGVLLWKRPIPEWFNTLWPLKSGPANLPRRLVAVGDEVYVTIGIDAPVVALDGATGKTLREYPGSAGTEEIIIENGVLLAVLNRTKVDLAADLKVDHEEGKTRDSRTTYSPTMKHIWAGVRSPRWSNSDRSVAAFDVADGKPKWEKKTVVLPLTLGADDTGVYYHDGDHVQALALGTGKPLWTSEPVPVWKGLQGQGLQSWFAPTLVVHGDKVLFAGGEKTHMSYMGWGSKDIGQDTFTALSVKTGEKLWTGPHAYAGYNSPEDLFVAAGKVWTGMTAKGGEGRYYGHDLGSGERITDFPPDVKTYWFHHRCYRAKATDKYILCSRTGIEFVDLKTGKWDINHWVRGGCLYGIMPCNGLVYSPPHPCACYPEAKLYGFVALAAEVASGEWPVASGERRLEKGHAYAEIQVSALSPQPSSWPTYRADAVRSGGVDGTVPATVKPAWKTKLSGKLTPPVAAGGKVYVAALGRHTIHALDTASGKTLWQYVAGGRVDSPPTFDRGRLLFGAGDGTVTCLRAADGTLAWRCRVAPADRRMVAFERLESVWPVHGSVLVQDGVATVVAGRSMYLDGGLRICRVDVETGRFLGERILDNSDPESGGSLQQHVKGLNMPVALPDILSSDGAHLYMRSLAMDLEGKRLEVRTGKTGGAHLFAPYGFTDDSWFHRTYWLYGDSFSGGVGGFGNAKSRPAGHILSADEDTVFGYGRKPEFYRWHSVADHQLFAAHKPGADVGGVVGLTFEKRASLNPQGKPLTIAAWIKPDRKDGTILARGAQAIGFALILTGGKPHMLLRAKDKTHQARAAEAVGEGWTHVAGRLDAEGRMQVFVNGKGGPVTSGVPLLTGDPLIPMKVGFDDTHQLLPKPLVPFSGALDEVMLFHKALSDAELQSLASGGGKVEGAVLHLAFDKGKTRDQSSGKNHGKLTEGKAQTVRGPVGDALVLKQPKTVVASSAGKRRGAGVAHKWTRDVPMSVRAMARAGNRLVVAGPPDLLDEVGAFEGFETEDAQKQIRAQDAALKGARGGMLHVVDAESGKTLSECKLDSPPVFDGLIAAGGRVYFADMAGNVVCMGE